MIATSPFISDIRPDRLALIARLKRDRVQGEIKTIISISCARIDNDDFELMLFGVFFEGLLVACYRKRDDGRIQKIPFLLKKIRIVLSEDFDELL